MRGRCGHSLRGADERGRQLRHGAVQRASPLSPIEDQNIACGIIWGAGDLTSTIILTVFFVQWYGHSKREAIRVDRQSDREERLAAQAAVAGYHADEPGRQTADEERA